MEKNKSFVKNSCNDIEEAQVVCCHVSNLVCTSFTTGEITVRELVTNEKVWTMDLDEKDGLAHFQVLLKGFSPNGKYLFFLKKNTESFYDLNDNRINFLYCIMARTGVVVDVIPIVTSIHSSNYRQIGLMTIGTCFDHVNADTWVAVDIGNGIEIFLVGDAIHDPIVIDECDIGEESLFENVSYNVSKTSLAFSPDGMFLIVGFANGVVKTWNCDNESLESRVQLDVNGSVENVIHVKFLNNCMEEVYFVTNNCKVWIREFPSLKWKDLLLDFVPLFEHEQCALKSTCAKVQLCGEESMFGYVIDPMFPSKVILRNLCSRTPWWKVIESHLDSEIVHVSVTRCETKMYIGSEDGTYVVFSI